jgi:hypothetical protein
MLAKAIGIRWTIGDVSDEGFEALRLSVWGAYQAFGADAAYVIGLNTVPLEVAKRRTGELPAACEWHEVTGAIPRRLASLLDGGMAQGAGWKLAPLQMFPDRFELSLDNDCILWAVPEPIRRWRDAADGACLLAEDVRACFGQFASECGDAPRNAGIRGLPPGFDLEQAMLDVVRTGGHVLTSELDEQGLQVAAITRSRPLEVVTLADVTICSPFPPHLPHLGRCGAHFCGLNARDLGWQLDGRPASAHVRDHWRRFRSELYARVGLPMPSAESGADGASSDADGSPSSRSASPASSRQRAPVQPNARRS